MNNSAKLKNERIFFWMLLIGFGLTGIAQPITYKGYGKSDWWKMNQYNNEMYILENKTFAFYDLDALLVGDKKLIKYTYKSTDGQNLWSFKSDQQFVISNVTFVDSLIDNNNLLQDDFNKRLLFSTEINLRFQNCKAPLLELSGIKNDHYLVWWHNKFSEVQFRGMKVGLFAEDNRFHSFISWAGEYSAFYLKGNELPRGRASRYRVTRKITAIDFC
ncbi:hypothetical protein CLU83_0509 [Flavobacterium sp. 1]|uniref:hypothetical protein n=1 Tax=Flavobacterium sp. 1 TaxID=2035200 RepID=UPI000C23ED98|nr:hypothetical protein [Flavobacterium sp. 1]PJJ07346.1 hypothetical protein CLU83_0509 [Flavobacterium sp. 1]